MSKYVVREGVGKAVEQVRGFTYLWGYILYIAEQGNTNNVSVLSFLCMITTNPIDSNCTYPWNRLYSPSSSSSNLNLTHSTLSS
jgi:hypothetical protein